jgi:hypothetical protein
LDGIREVADVLTARMVKKSTQVRSHSSDDRGNNFFWGLLVGALISSD